MSMTRSAALFIANHQPPMGEPDICWWCGWTGFEHYNLCPLVQANEVISKSEAEDFNASMAK